MPDPRQDAQREYSTFLDEESYSGALSYGIEAGLAPEKIAESLMSMAEERDLGERGHEDDLTPYAGFVRENMDPLIAAFAPPDPDRQDRYMLLKLLKKAGKFDIDMPKPYQIEPVETLGSEGPKFAVGPQVSDRGVNIGPEQFLGQRPPWEADTRPAQDYKMFEDFKRATEYADTVPFSRESMMGALLEAVQREKVRQREAYRNNRETKLSLERLGVRGF